MNQLKCEMCGSTDLVKQDGFFICQVCGTKYSVEEAKKMMIEGTVDVSGSTVKVDNSAFVRKYLENARRALSKEDWDEVEKYYNMVEQNSPNNMEAVFFSSYGKAMLSLMDNEYYKRQQKFDVLKKSISIISDSFEVTDENREEVICMIDKYINKMESASFVYNIESMLGVGSSMWCKNLFKTTKQAFIVELKQISEKHNEDYILNLLAKYENKNENTKVESKPLSNTFLVIGLLAFGLGVALLFGIIIVGLTVYGRVYFFDGYTITQVLTTLSIIGIVLGFIGILAGIILKSYKK